MQKMSRLSVMEKEGVKYLHNFCAFAFPWVLLLPWKCFRSLFWFSTSSPHLSERLLRAVLIFIT